jgi:SAM-dependent methyltransferase
MNAKAHWESVYQSKRPDEVSWFQPDPVTSLDLIRRVAPDPASAILDIGGGTSRLAGALIAAGYQNVTVLDLSAAALAASRERLGVAGASVHWLEDDVLTAEFPSAAFDVWHDRALFHFLTDTSDRARYVEQMRKAVTPGGAVIIATFADDGPTRCSGLPVVRYAIDGLSAELGTPFQLVGHVREAHVTPGGSTQAFVYGLFTLRR